MSNLRGYEPRLLAKVCAGLLREKFGFIAGRNRYFNGRIFLIRPCESRNGNRRQNISEALLFPANGKRFLIIAFVHHNHDE